MAYTKTDPVDVTPGSAGAWTDVSEGLPANASVVHLRVVTGDDGSNYDFGARKKGSTDNRTQYIRRGGRQGVWIGVDGSGIYQLYVGSTTLVKVYRVGYDTNDNVVMRDNGLQKAVSSGAFQDVSIAADTGADTAIGCFLEWTNSLAYAHRKKGSTDNRVFAAEQHLFTCAGCDGSEVTQVFRTSGGVDPYLIGYAKAGATFNTNAPDRSLGSTGSYIDLTALPSGAAAGIYEIVTTGSETYALRENGKTDDHVGGPGGLSSNHSFETCNADASLLVEGKISGTACDFFEIGFWNAAAGGVSGTIAATLDAFTSAITGTPTVNGTIAATMQNHTSAISGTTTVTGTMAAVLAAFTSAISGTATIVGTMAATLANLFSSISGSVGGAAAVSWLLSIARRRGRR